MNKYLKYIVYTLLFVLVLLTVAFLFLRQSDRDLEYLKEKYAQAPSQFVEVDGINIHYRIEGNGPTLVLLHGTAASLHTWDGWTRILSDSFRIVRLDLPAFGLTGPHAQRDYSAEAYVKVLDDFCNKLGIDSFSLAGNSLGGYVAWNYAVQYPEKVEKLILLDAAGFYMKEPSIFKLIRNPILGPLMMAISPRSIYENNLAEVYSQDDKIYPELIDRYYDLSLRPGNRQALRDRILSTHVSDTLALATLNMPVLIQWGAEDAWVPPSHAEKFAELLTNDTIIMYPHLGHVPMEEDPAITAADVRIFLKK